MNTLVDRLRRPLGAQPTPPGIERRVAPRFEPDPWIPVFFRAPNDPTPWVGYVADVSASGLRLIAPPTTRAGLHWGDAVTVEVCPCAGTRARGISGLVLRAEVARVVSDINGLTLGIRLRDPIDPIPWAGPEPVPENSGS